MTCLALLLLSALGAAEAPDSLDEFFERYAKQRDGVRVLEARFSQKNLLPGEDISGTQGTLFYARPRRIVLRTDDPETVTLVDGDKYYEYDAEFKQLVIYSLESEATADVFFLAFDQDTASLRKNYLVDMLRRDDPRGHDGILIRPKREEGSTPPFEEVSVFLRESDMLPYEVRIAHDADSQVFFYISEYVVNGDTAPEKSQLVLPEGTKVIENDVVIETVGTGGKRIPQAIDEGKNE
jgi:outer membrane lipoprotein-sorting protein